MERPAAGLDGTVAQKVLTSRRQAWGPPLLLLAGLICALFGWPPLAALPQEASWMERVDPRCVRLYEQLRAAGDGRSGFAADDPSPPSGAAPPGSLTESPGASRPLGFVLDSALLACGRLRLQIDTGPAGCDAQELRLDCLTLVPSACWEGATGRWGQLTLAIEELPLLAQVPGLFYASLPPRGMRLKDSGLVSAGVAEIGAPPYHARGFSGEEIRVGVLDLGFAGLARVWGTEIPQDTRTRSFYGSAEGDGDLSGGGDSHGTACAEIVHDAAPASRLYLSNASTPVELEAAVRWLRDEGVSVISHSVGWFFGPGDGTGTIDDIAQGASRDGIIWANAAGNQAQMYWEGDFEDEDSDGLEEFTPGDESIHYAPGEGGQQFDFVLTWNRWPYSTDLAFAIEVWEDGELTLSSESVYGPTWPYAYQDLSFTRRRPGKAVDIRLRRVEGTLAARLRLFRIDGEELGEHGTSSGSIVMPADAASVLAVGAYRVGAGFLEPFSSRGPNQAGVAKPELCAPDGVSTVTIPIFGGTSACAPLAAGEAALLLSTVPPGGFFDFHWSVDELRRLLEWSAAPDTFPDPHACAWGLLRLPLLDGELARTGGGSLRPVSPSRPPLRAYFTPALSAAHLARIHDLTGRLLAEIPLLPAVPYRPLEIRWSPPPASPAGWYWISIRGPGGTIRGRALVVR
jgi:hypothetical protein